jgi:hypothetical protein
MIDRAVASGLIESQRLPSNRADEVLYQLSSFQNVGKNVDYSMDQIKSHLKSMT